jgi:hypothetical protein
MIDFDLSIFIKIFTSWQVILIALLILVLFPMIFYLASFGKAPVEFRMKPLRKKAAAKSVPGAVHAKEEAEEEATDPGDDEGEPA